MDRVLVLIGLQVFVIYAIFMTWICRDVPESVSETSYRLKERYGVTLPFTLLCMMSALSIFPSWVGQTPEKYQFLPFLATVGMMFAGATPLFRERFHAAIHYTSGAVSFLAGIVWMIAMRHYTPVYIIAGAGLVWTAIQRKKYVFIFEFIGYVMICLTLLRSA